MLAATEDNLVVAPAVQAASGSLPERVRPIRDLPAKVMICVWMLVLASLSIWIWADLDAAMKFLWSTLHGRIIMIVTQVLFLANALAFLWRVYLALRYRSVPACTDEELPTCTVIIPAYNEGRHVLETLRSVVQSDYPAEKMEIIAIDDGSADDTWHWMQVAEMEMPGRITIYRMRRNRGKRRALCEGFRRGRGEMVVTIDSDSQVDPETIRRLVSPLKRDPKVGGVAGNVRVLNQDEGLIPRMMEVSFVYSFDFMRASESEVNTVMCTPGALAAYRRDIVLDVLPEWMDQRFMGRPANIGEDRALTNLILRSGYHVTFQRSAMVYTKVPTGHRGLCRMLLRWGRSNIREAMSMSSFAFRKFREGGAWGARINLITQWASMTLAQILKLATLAYLIWKPGLFLVQLLMGAGVVSCGPAFVYALRHRSTNALWAFPYSVFWLIGLSWITIYAWMTPQNNGWLTRNRPASSETIPLVPPTPLKRKSA